MASKLSVIELRSLLCNLRYQTRDVKLGKAEGSTLKQTRACLPAAPFVLPRAVTLGKILLFGSRSSHATPITGILVV